MGTMQSFTDKVTACISQLSEKNTAFLLRHFNSESFLFPRTQTIQSQLTAGVFRRARGPLSFRLASLRPDLLQSHLLSIHTQPSDKAICCSQFPCMSLPHSEKPSYYLSLLSISVQGSAPAGIYPLNLWTTLWWMATKNVESPQTRRTKLTHCFPLVLKHLVCMCCSTWPSFSIVLGRAPFISGLLLLLLY